MPEAKLGPVLVAFELSRPFGPTRATARLDIVIDSIDGLVPVQVVVYVEPGTEHLLPQLPPKEKP